MVAIAVPENPTVSLVAAGPSLMPGLEPMLLGLGDGEAGFGGTSFARGERTLRQFLADCVLEREPGQIAPNRVPQTTFWIVVAGTVAGMLRMRHRLNDALRVSGGHIGYYVSPRARRRGVATQALGLALAELRRLGVPRALLTVYPRNAGSIRVIEHHGGVLSAHVTDAQGQLLNQYWIELDPPAQRQAWRAPDADAGPRRPSRTR